MLTGGSGPLTVRSGRMIAMERQVLNWLVDELGLVVFSFDGARFAPFSRESARFLPEPADLDAARARLGGALCPTTLVRAHEARTTEKIAWAEGSAYIVPLGGEILIFIHPEQAESMQRAMATHDTSHALGLVVAWSRLAESSDEQGVRAAMQGIRGAVEAARMALTGEEQEDREITAVREVVDEVIQLLEPLATQRRLRVTIDVPPELEVVAPRSVVYRSIWNVVENAYSALGMEQRVRIEAHAHETHASIRIEDDGPGVPARLVPTLFAKRPDAGRSRGLGLSGVAESLSSAGGSIRLERAAPGACFVIELPSAARAERKLSGVRPLSLAPTVLIVEDDPALLELLTHTFECEGLAVEARRDGLADEVGRFDAALIDLHLASTDGSSLVARLVEEGFQGELHLMSGGEPPRGFADRVEFRFHRKPFDPMVVAAELRASLHSKRATPRKSAALP